MRSHLAGGLVCGLALALSASPSPAAGPSWDTVCKTGPKRIARDMRADTEHRLARGTQTRDITGCSGRWAVITRPGEGDTSYNAHFTHGRWHYYSAYPMASCARVPSWLCPTHP